MEVQTPSCYGSLTTRFFAVAGQRVDTDVEVTPHFVGMTASSCEGVWFVIHPITSIRCAPENIPDAIGD